MTFVIKAIPTNGQKVVHKATSNVFCHFGGHKAFVSDLAECWPLGYFAKQRIMTVEVLKAGCISPPWIVTILYKYILVVNKYKW